MIAVLKLLKVDDITARFEQQLEADIEQVDKQSAQHLKDTIRPKMNFSELGIPVGSILVSRDGRMQVTVVGEKKVDLNGTVCSLTMATRRLLGYPDDRPLQPSPYWTFNGKTVKEIYEEYHSGLLEDN